MPRSLISLGANLGNTHENMLAASRLLIDEFGAAQLRFSRLYRTPPIGGPVGQSDFLNAVASIESERSCWEIWQAIKRIETDLGRQRMHRWEARRIDIDLLLHGEHRVWTPHLKIPHPRMCMRVFVLEPACEIAADAVDPVTGWTIAHLRAYLAPDPKRTAMVLCNTSDLVHRLRTALVPSASLQNSEATRDSSPLRFVHCPDPLAIRTHLQTVSTELVMAAVSTPDPETIQWEDYSRPWAVALELTDAPKTLDGSSAAIHGPRYLFPANDGDWAVHEIQSALAAMSCEIHPTQLVFPTPV